MRNEIKLFNIIRALRWRYLCFPKKLEVRYRTLPQYVSAGQIRILHLYKGRRFLVAIGCEEEEEIDYDFFAKSFFNAYKRLKFKFRRAAMQRRGLSTWRILCIKIKKLFKSKLDVKLDGKIKRNREYWLNHHHRNKFYRCAWCNGKTVPNTHVHYFK